MKWTKKSLRIKQRDSIDEIFAKIDELEVKKDKAIGEAKIEYEEKLAELKTKKIELQAKYDKLVEATEENWERLKLHFLLRRNPLKRGFSKIASLFK